MVCTLAACPEPHKWLKNMTVKIPQDRDIDKEKSPESLEPRGFGAHFGRRTESGLERETGFEPATLSLGS